MKRTRFTDVLLESGVVSQDLLNKARAHAEKAGVPLLDTLYKSKAVSDKNTIHKIGKVLGIPPIELKYVRPQAYVTRLIPKDFAKENKVLPVSVKQENGTDVLYCALLDPTDEVLLTQVEEIANKPVRPLLSGYDDLRESIDRFYSPARPARRRTTSSNSQTRKPEPAVPQLFATEAAPPQREVLPGMLAVSKSSIPDLRDPASDISSFSIPTFTHESSTTIRRPTPDSLSESQIKPYQRASSFTDVRPKGSPQNNVTPPPELLESFEKLEVAPLRNLRQSTEQTDVPIKVPNYMGLTPVAPTKTPSKKK